MQVFWCHYHNVMCHALKQTLNMLWQGSRTSLTSTMVWKKKKAFQYQLALRHQMVDIMFWLFLNTPKNIWSGEIKRKHYVTTFLKTKQTNKQNQQQQQPKKKQTAKPKHPKTQTEKHLLKIFYNIPVIFSLITILSSSHSSIRSMRGCSTHRNSTKSYVSTFYICVSHFEEHSLWNY